VYCGNTDASPPNELERNSKGSSVQQSLKIPILSPIPDATTKITDNLFSPSVQTGSFPERQSAKCYLCKTLNNRLSRITYGYVTNNFSTTRLSCQRSQIMTTQDTYTVTCSIRFLLHQRSPSLEIQTRTTRFFAQRRINLFVIILRMTTGSCHLCLLLQAFKYSSLQ